MGATIHTYMKRAWRAGAEETGVCEEGERIIYTGLLIFSVSKYLLTLLTNGLRSKGFSR